MGRLLPQAFVNRAGSGLHINFSVKGPEGSDPLPHVIAGLLDQAYPLTAFLNPTANSYLRLGSSKAPGYITWSSENRSQLIRIPAAVGESRRAELRSADPAANPYLAFAMLIYAGLYGIKQGLTLPAPADFNLYTAPAGVLPLPSAAHLPGRGYERRLGEQVCHPAPAPLGSRRLLPPERLISFGEGGDVMVFQERTYSVLVVSASAAF